MKFFREASLKVKIRNQSFDGYVDTITIKDLRIAFNITKSLAPSTNTANVRVWGLKQSTRNLIKDYGDEITIYAGYRDDGGTQVLFVGDTTAVYHIYDQPEIVSVFECADGDKFINQLRVNVSFQENASVRTIIQTVADQMGITITEFAETDNIVYREGFSYIGMGKDALSILTEKLNLQWSVQNNTLQLIPLTGTILQPAISVNENNGMQGIPQRFTYRRLFLYKATDAPRTGYKVNVALNPYITPGSKIDLFSAHLDIKGLQRVENVIHNGDTWGYDWTSQLELTELIGA